MMRSENVKKYAICGFAKKMKKTETLQRRESCRKLEQNAKRKTKQQQNTNKWYDKVNFSTATLTLC